MTRFVAGRFDLEDDGNYRASGQLTLRDVSKAVAFPSPSRSNRTATARQAVRATGELEIMRLDYGVGQGLFKDTSMVPDAVTIVIDIAAHRAAE